jgi:hypothetical protein
MVIRTSLGILTLLLGACGGPAEPTDLRLLSLDGAEVSPFSGSDDETLVFVFVSTQCPIANRYAPEIQALADAYSPRGAVFRLIYPDPADTPEAIAAHLAEYDYELVAWRDPEHRAVALSGATVTPEAVVFDAHGRRLYRGRIDDRAVDFGQNRPAATSRDLAAALDEVLDNSPVTRPETPAVGCYIADLR